MKNKINIGLFGLGCVGSGLYTLVNEVANNLVIKKIAVKNLDKPRKFNCTDILTTNKYDILHDEDIEIIVEVIDDANEAFNIVKEALILGKPVVSANKKMIAEHMSELILLQKQFKTPLLYEGAVGGSIPILHLLNGYFCNDKVYQVTGILNGTTNYILTKTMQNLKDYKDVLVEAQELGFTESNPVLDVEAYDSKFKLCILIKQAFGKVVNPTQILNIGITNIQTSDIRFAQKINLRIKLIAHASCTDENYYAYVIPTFVEESSNFYNIIDQFNGIEINTAFCGKQLYTGKGAGSIPTAAAILADVNVLIGNSFQAPTTHLKETAFQQIDIEIPVYLRSSNQALAKALMHKVEKVFNGHLYFQAIGYTKLSTLIANKHQLTDSFIAALSPSILQQINGYEKPNKTAHSIH